MEKKTLLEIIDLATYFFVHDGIVKAVDGANLKIHEGEVLSIVGESGSGKSVTALSAMRLIPEPPGKTIRGKVIFDEIELTNLSRKEMQDIRGNRISMIFQNPYAAMNPLITIGEQLVETVKKHKKTNISQSKEIISYLFIRLGIQQPLSIFKKFPYEISMGISQRVMLASALLGDPEILIADEPTTMLDAISQVEILNLIKELKEELGMSVWLITHDFGVVSVMADQVIVMYAGKPVESGTTARVLKDPKHPYTKGLIDSVPIPGTTAKRLKQIQGEIPDLKKLPPGCSFAPRCSEVKEICSKTEPPTIDLPEGGTTRCWLYGNRG